MSISMRLSAHFGHWLEVGRRGRKVLRWQLAAELIYSQVMKSYRRRKLTRVTPVMRLGTEAALKVVLQGLGFSGRLNTAFIERVNLTVRHGIAALDVAPGRLPNKPHSFWPIWSGGEPSITDVASSPITPSGARAATRARWQTSGATLPKTHRSSGNRENQPTVVNARSPVLSFAESRYASPCERE
jgi:hypothetical protein